MIRHFCLYTLCLCSCFSSAEETKEDAPLASNISNWRDVAKKRLADAKEASGVDKHYLITSYRFTLNSHYAGDFYCNTSTQLTGHKFIDGTACKITYQFVARNEYNELQLEGSFLKSQHVETCEEAEKICKQIKISFKERDDQLEVLNQDKLIARIIYKNGLPGFLSEK